MSGLIGSSARPLRQSRYRRYPARPQRARFFSVVELSTLGVAVIVLLALLFPRDLVNRQLDLAPRASAATIAYLKLQLRARQDDSQIRIRLAVEQIKAGQLDPAEHTLKPLIAHALPGARAAAIWLRLQRARFVAVPADSPRRDAARKEYEAALHTYDPLLGSDDMLLVTRQAIASGLYSTAADLAQKLLDTTAAGAVRRGHAPTTSADVMPEDILANPVMSPAPHEGLQHLFGLIWRIRATTSAAPHRAPATASIDDLRRQSFGLLLQSYLAAGDPRSALRAAQLNVDALPPREMPWAHLIRIATWAGESAAGADFARRWLLVADDDAERWQAFNALIDAYLAAGEPHQALTAAQAQLGRIRPDAALWRRMTKLALQAGEGRVAAGYAKRLVGLEDVHAH